MSAKLTRVHLGLGMAEIGVQFEIDDGAGGTVTQRAFVVVDDAALVPVWGAARAALDASLAHLPLDLPPGAVTTALMKQRTAEQAEKIARDAQLEAEKKRAEAEERRKAALLVVEAAEKQAADVDAATTQAAERLAAKRAELAALDEQIAAKRAEATKEIAAS